MLCRMVVISHPGATGLNDNVNYLFLFLILTTAVVSPVSGPCE
jgi:hypothetical protein